MQERENFLESLSRNIEVGLIIAVAWIYGIFHPNEPSGYDDWEQ